MLVFGHCELLHPIYLSVDPSEVDQAGISMDKDTAAQEAMDGLRVM